MDLTRIEKLVLLDFLEYASDRMSVAGSNDYIIVADAQGTELVEKAYAEQGLAGEDVPKPFKREHVPYSCMVYNVTDYIILYYLQHKIEKEL